MDQLYFSSDYMEGAHPKLMERLMETNLEKTAGYGTDPFCEAAGEKIREACNAPEADVFFLAGGTQTNRVVIDCLLMPYQGVMAAETGHISVHEAGAIEQGGHKVLQIPQKNGKVSVSGVEECILAYLRDDNREHMVMPGMLYLSQPTEYGTLYTLEEIRALSALCRKHAVALYVDGARLAYALAAPENDVTLKDLASYCDVFYIGGTKCGALFGEAVVFPERNRVPHFFSMVKQHGALMAKGRILGLMFDTLFTDDLYRKIGENGIRRAARLREALREKGYRLLFDSPTNQIFVEMTQEKRRKLEERVVMGFMENLPEERVIMRFCTGFATTEEEVEQLIALL